jgi:hypothetical protein
MPPDSPQHQHALPRNRVVEVIERAQEDVLRELRQAGIPETEALLVIKRFLDLLYREFKELLANDLLANDPHRSKAHQEWLDTKAGGLLLTLESFISALVAEALNKAKEDYRAEMSKPREVIPAVPAKQQPSLWEETRENLGRLLRNPVVHWSVGMPVWFLVWLLVTGSTTWALIALGISAFVVWLFGKPGLVSILIAGGVCLLLLL